MTQNAKRKTITINNFSTCIYNIQASEIRRDSTEWMNEWKHNEFIKRWKVMTWRWVWHIKNEIKLKLKKQKEKRSTQKNSVNLLVVYSISLPTISSVEFSSVLRSSQFTMHFFVHFLWWFQFVECFLFFGFVFSFFLRVINWVFFPKHCTCDETFTKELNSIVHVVVKWRFFLIDSQRSPSFSIMKTCFMDL